MAGRNSSCGTEPEQAAERAGEQQRAGAGVDALAGDVDQRHLELAAVVRPGGDQEVAGERRAAGGAQHDLGLTSRLGQGRHLALGGQPVAQVDQHRVAAGPLHPQPPARPGERCTIAPVTAITRTAPGDTGGSVGLHDLEDDDAAATTTSSSSRLRTVSRKPPASTTRASVVSGNHGPVVRNRMPGGGRAGCSGQQREPVRVQHVPPHPGTWRATSWPAGRGGGSVGWLPWRRQYRSGPRDDVQLAATIALARRRARSGRHGRMTHRRSAWPVRTLGDSDWPAFIDVDSNAFGNTFPEEMVEEPTGRSTSRAGASARTTRTARRHRDGVPVRA